MSLAITHFAVGGICTALIALYLLPPTRYARTFVLLGGGWGMVPDVHWVAPLYAPELKALHASVFTNIFWFHQTLDVIDPTDSYTMAALALAGFIGTVSLGDHWSYQTTEHTTPRTDPPTGQFTAVRSLETLVRAAGLCGLGCGLGVALLGSVYPGVGGLRGLYLGVGAALAGTGGIALGGQLTVSPWVFSWLSTPVTRGLVVFGSLILTIGGGTLVATPLRHGVTSESGVVAAVGGLLLVLAVVSGRVRLQL